MIGFEAQDTWSYYGKVFIEYSDSDVGGCAAIQGIARTTVSIGYGRSIELVGPVFIGICCNQVFTAQRNIL